jgi:hydroxymethylpyrimidine/phosphomethylpyrimidine kinase
MVAGGGIAGSVNHSQSGQMRGRVLVVAASDSGGGAGIQGDIKTITTLGGYAATAVTAIMAQDTRGVHAVHPVPSDFLRLQLECVLDDIGADAVKTGMLGDHASIGAACDVLERKARGIRLVVDPILASGRRLLSDEAVAEVKRRLMPLAYVLTPNVPEAELLGGMAIGDEGSTHDAAEALRTLGIPVVLLKGGHLPGEEVVDMLATDAGVEVFRSPRIVTRHLHGTGCTLASGIAVGLAQGMPVRDAVLRARAFVHAAIANAPGYGNGHGPLNHAIACPPW